MLLALVGLALADSPYLLSHGASVVYGGVGMSTFEYGSSGELRDRQYRARVDSYAARGLGERLQLAVDVPLVRTGILIEHDDRPPCPRDTDLCEPVTTVGELGVHLRARIPAGSWVASADVGLRTDQWNAGTRHRWTNAGQGATTALFSALAGHGVGPVFVSGVARYGLVVGRPVDTSDGIEWLPPDYVAGELRAGAPMGQRLRGELATTAFSRLGGLPFGSEWSARYPSSDIWSGLAYRELRAEAKLSVSLGDNAGVHLGLGRVVVAASGPKDTWDVALGIHRYWGP